MDGTFFSEPKRIDGKIIAKCNTCGELKKGDEKSTGNFIKHYRTHPSEAKKLNEYLKNNNSAHDGAMLMSSHQKQLEIRDILAPVSGDKVNLILFKITYSKFYQRIAFQRLSM